MPVVVASGNVSVSPTAQPGTSIYKLISAATTNAASVKASAGNIYGWFLFNGHQTYTRYVKFYDKATAPVVGTDVPVMTIPLPSGAGANVSFPQGVGFTNGIALAITASVNDNASDAIGADEVVINLLYT